MASKQPNGQNGLSLFNSYIIRTIFSHNEQKSSAKSINRQESTPIKEPSVEVNPQINRRSSTPTLGKHVGSSRYVFFFLLFVI